MQIINVKVTFGIPAESEADAVLALIGCLNNVREQLPGWSLDPAASERMTLGVIAAAVEANTPSAQSS